MARTELDTAVYQLVRDAAKEGRRATVSEAVKQTGAARSSVYRVAQHYGYDSWMDFTTGLTRYFAQVAVRDTVSESIDAVAQAILRYRSKPILLDAVGDADICASYFQYRLAEQGFLAWIYTSSAARHWQQREEAGLAIIFNESGTALLPTCLEAAERGFEVIAITSSHDTPISKVCSMNVVIKNNKSSIENYEPNFFTAGTLSLIEYLLKRIEMEG